MIAYIDIETQGLDATKYITGVLKINKNKKYETYNNKKQLWQRILQIATACQKRNQILNIYSHNASYDTASYVPLNDKNLIIYSNNPFIWAYKINNKETIKFLDTYAIYKMSLQKLGKLVNIEKQQIPKKLLQKQIKGNYTKTELTQIQEYCKNDVLILQKAIMKLQEKLKNDNIILKRYYTISQIAIAYLIQKLQKSKQDLEHLFWNKQKGEIRRTFRGIQKWDENKESIHSAYRGGRIEAFKTGKIQNATSIDFNSLYPHSAIHMKFPNLKTERLTYHPNKQILKKIGISKAMITNKTNKLGILPIRLKNMSYFAKKGTTLIGTWTHQEINYALKNGYKLHNIEWSITYEETNNPLKEIYKELYEKRKNNPFDNWFYKQIMNRSIGKMAQHRTNQTIIIDSIKHVKEYLNKNYEVIKGIDYNYMYKQKKQRRKNKKYYAPIIPCLINAQARTTMNKQYKKIPLNDLLYTDTDSIKHTGNHLRKYKIGNNIGQFKIEKQNKPIIIWGRKTYMHENEIAIAGVNPKEITPQQFEQGTIQYKTMNTISTVKETKNVGTFYEETRNLHKQKQNYTESINELQKQTLLIDHDIHNVNYFIENINAL